MASRSVEGSSFETKRTYCKVCMTHCGLTADVVGDQIIRVRGDRDHPLTQGYTCPKGRAKFNAQLDFMGEPADLIIHPETAADHGISNGQRVRVRNASGEISLAARVDPMIRKDVCSISHGHLDGNVNFLTSSTEIDRLSGMAHYSGIPVEIEPL